MAMTDYYEQAVLDHLLDNTSLTSPTTVYVQVATASAEDDQSGVGNAVGNRISAAFTITSAGADNDADVTCDGITTGTVVTHVMIWDAASGGNVIFHDVIRDSNGDALSITVGSSGEITFSAGVLVVTLD